MFYLTADADHKLRKAVKKKPPDLITPLQVCLLRDTGE